MILGISGKSQSGKDTVGKIIQYLTDKNSFGYTHSDSEQDYNDYFKNNHNLKSNWQIKKFADTLKDIVCILTGCTREQLENIDFKNSKLGDKWTCKSKIKNNMYIRYTYRDLLQKLGTDLLRNQLHENVWVNALFNKYDKFENIDSYTCNTGWANCKINHKCHTCLEVIKTYKSNWIITDTRFPNEAKSIKDRNGILIRVERFDDSDMQMSHRCQHESETALDNYPFDYTINNNDTIEELIVKVKEILIKEKII